MVKHLDQRVGVFVDVQNMYYSAKNLYGSKVNFGKILETAVSKRKLVRAIAYVIKAENLEEQKFFEALSKQGFTVKMKELQTFPGGAKKGDWDIGMAIDMIALSSSIDAVVLVTGDGDFVPLLQYLQFLGKQVEVMAFESTASNKLMEAADEFTDLSENKNLFLLRKSK